ncbi:methionine aminotransferase [Pedobacter sp.]|uniref:methionine aminotransferase n=1 Tax=Pedobacter sp. TaxID=1411316 RepID=UPI003D7F3AB9
MISTPSKLPGTGTNIFSAMSLLAEQHQAINLSQGFPDYDCDPKLTELVNEAMKGGFNQYAPMAGLLSLRELIANKVQHLYQASYNPETEITVTAGGTQAIFTALASCINPGDEVIIFEPAYDCYAPTIKMFGGLVKPYVMHAPNYTIDWDMVKKLFSANTKMIILNSPHNPTGCVLAEKDLQELIKLTKNTDVLILSDEVYEHVIYDGQPHLSVSSYPELKERAFVVASFGKLLHTTGWKTGYCIAPSFLMKEFRKIHQYNVFSVNTPMQVAIAKYLEDTSVYTALSLFFQEKRDSFRNMLAQTKFELLPCKGSYFQCVTYKKISQESDVALVTRLIKEFGVAAIPLSAFYSRNTDSYVLRFCFAKKQETLEKAVERLMKL